MTVELDGSVRDARHWIALRDVPGLRRAQAHGLVRRFGSPRAVFGRSVSALGPECPGQAAAVLARPASLRDADAELESARRLGLRVLTAGSPEFPAALREIPDAPLVLYVRGALPAAARSLAVVGSRRPSERARGCARGFASELAGAGAWIVSGLAYGIDAAAHLGALDANGRTLAVLACGLDAPSPMGHRRLAELILAGGGGWLSEHPPGRRARPYYFPERNRLISGIARCTLIVEARERSGSLWTARHALEQGRDVLTVPGPIDSDLCRGSNSLLRDGAGVILDVDDLLFAALGVSKPSRPAGAASRAKPLPADASPEARKIVDLLGAGPLDADTLGRAAGLGAATLAGALLELELGGVVVRNGARLSLAA